MLCVAKNHVIYILLLTICVEHSVKGWTKVLKYKGWTADENSTVLLETTGNILACINICVASPKCIVAYFNRISGACKRDSSRLINIREGHDDDYVLFVRGIAGILAGKSPRYQYNYTAAAEVCMSLEGRLMTALEMDQLYQDGFDQCQCGWLNEGDMRFPILTGRPGCGPGPGVQICDPQYFNAGDAWCTV